MFYSEEELLTDIDSTLDQLIQNAKILHTCDKMLCGRELLLLEKTQDSLIAKFMHTQENIEGIHLEQELLNKIQKLHQLAPTLLENFTKELTKNHSVGLRPRIGRNRKKSKVREFAYRSF
jgi:Zn-dependent oligopeptidase